MAVAFKETAEFVRGEQFERALSRFLQGRGWAILPVYNYAPSDEKAPALEAADGDLVLPDLLGARAGVVYWFEAKRKARADYTRKTQRYETGLSLRLLNQYRAVKERSGIPVYLCFGHEQEQEVRWCELDGVRWREYRGPHMGRGGMAFVPWDELRQLSPPVRFSIADGGCRLTSLPASVEETA